VEWPGDTLLKVQMNGDLLTEDLKKKRSSSESFWLIGQPEIILETIKEGKDKGKYQVNSQSAPLRKARVNYTNVHISTTEYNYQLI
jgi:hypothetical protein